MGIEMSGGIRGKQSSLQKYVECFGVTAGRVYGKFPASGRVSKRELLGRLRRRETLDGRFACCSRQRMLWQTK